MSRAAASASPRLRARPLTLHLRRRRPTEPATTLPPASTAALLLAVAPTAFSCLLPHHAVMDRALDDVISDRQASHPAASRDHKRPC